MYAIGGDPWIRRSVHLSQFRNPQQMRTVARVDADLGAAGSEVVSLTGDRA
jgi:hypothetical protein